VKDFRVGRQLRKGMPHYPSGKERNQSAMSRVHVDKSVSGTVEFDDDREQPLLITAKKLAQLLGVSTRTLWRLRSAGQLPEPMRLGGAVRWRVDEVQEWIAGGCQGTSGRGQ
jgi:excisionase family DNA binding protein